MAEPDAEMTRTLVALADLAPDASPETWPELDRDGRAAAALVTGYMDAVPGGDVGAAWRAMPRPLRALVRHRNPAISVYAAGAAARA